MYAPIWRSITVNRSSLWKRSASYELESRRPRLCSVTSVPLVLMTVSGSFSPSFTGSAIFSVVSVEAWIVR